MEKLIRLGRRKEGRKAYTILGCVAATSKNRGCPFFIRAPKVLPGPGFAFLRKPETENRKLPLGGHPFDPRPQGRQFLHQAGVAPVQVIDPEDFGGAAGCQAGHY